MNEILFDILKVVIVAATVIIVRYVIPLLKEQIDSIKDARLRDAIKEAVYCAEQTIQKGVDKKDFVTQFIVKWLDARSIKASEEEIDALIESAVYSLKESNF